MYLYWLYFFLLLQIQLLYYMEKIIWFHPNRLHSLIIITKRKQWYIQKTTFLNYILITFLLDEPVLFISSPLPLSFISPLSLNRSSPKTIGPVSYTHLDVYKRQVQEELLECHEITPPSAGYDSVWRSSSGYIVMVEINLLSMQSTTRAPLHYNINLHKYFIIGRGMREAEEFIYEIFMHTKNKIKGLDE